MSSSEKQASSENRQSTAPAPLQGGRWREIRFEELKRPDVSPAAQTPTQSVEPEAEPEPELKEEPVTEATEPEASGDSMEDSLPNRAIEDSLARRPSVVAQPAEATQPTKGARASGSEPRVVRLERRQELERHIRTSPTDLDAYMELGRIYRAENRPADARRVFQLALQIFPDDLELRWEHEEATLARSLQQLREVTDVAKRLDTAESDRELRRCQNDWACRRMEVCRARLTRDPSLNHLRIVLAEAMYDADLYEGAIEELQTVMDMDEFSPNAFLIQGRCLLAMGKNLEAMVSLRAASLRRAVVAPVRVRVMALRLLCETAQRLGISLTLDQYRQHLEKAEEELAELANRAQD